MFSWRRPRADATFYNKPHRRAVVLARDRTVSPKANTGAVNDIETMQKGNGSSFRIDLQLWRKLLHFFLITLFPAWRARP